MSSEKTSLIALARERHEKVLLETERAEVLRKAEEAKAGHAKRMAVLAAWERIQPEIPLPRTLELGQAEFEIEGISFGFMQEVRFSGSLDFFTPGGWGLARLLTCEICGERTRTALLDSPVQLIRAVVDPHPWYGHECHFPKVSPRGPVEEPSPDETLEERLVGVLRELIREELSRSGYAG